MTKRPHTYKNMNKDDNIHISEALKADGRTNEYYHLNQNKTVYEFVVKLRESNILMNRVIISHQEIVVKQFKKQNGLSRRRLKRL